MGSLKHLGILSPPTCVGLRYGSDFCSTRSFSWKPGITNSSCPKTRLVLLLGLNGNAFGFVRPQPTRQNQHFRSLAWLPFSVPACFNAQSECRNINLLSIAYASRPRLRIRLTPGGLTWPGKPWVYGERVSHSFCRYSLWHNLLSKLQQSFRSAFTAMTMLPYHLHSP